MNPLSIGEILVKVIWFCAMAALVCFGILICAAGALLVGASFHDTREQAQRNFLEFVEAWK